MTTKDLYEVLLGHDEVSDDESEGDLTPFNEDLGLEDDGDFLDLDQINFEDDL